VHRLKATVPGSRFQGLKGVDVQCLMNLLRHFRPDAGYRLEQVNRVKCAAIALAMPLPIFGSAIKPALPPVSVNSPISCFSRETVSLARR
jgi:uncharacterized protein YbjT (DUF2867 family)